MANSVQDTYPEYPVFKGLQRPLEFLGLQGRYIYWAAGIVGSALIIFIIAFLVVGFLAALVTATFILAIGGVLVFIKQRKGLHSKEEEKGVFIFAHSRNIL